MRSARRSLRLPARSSGWHRYSKRRRRPAPRNPSRRGRKLRLSAERRAALKLQGQYMGHLRSLKPRQKARVKALRAAKGVRPAIAFARRLARR